MALLENRAKKMAKSYSQIIKRLFTMTIINVIAISWGLKVAGKQFTGTACEWPDEVKESLFFRGDPSPPCAGGRGNFAFAVHPWVSRFFNRMLFGISEGGLTLIIL